MILRATSILNESINAVAEKLFRLIFVHRFEKLQNLCHGEEFGRRLTKLATTYWVRRELIQFLGGEICLREGRNPSVVNIRAAFGGRRAIGVKSSGFDCR